MRLGGAQPRCGVEARGGMNPSGEEEAAEGSRRAVEDGEKAGFSQVMISVWQGQEAPLPVGHHIVITQSLASGLSGVENSPIGKGVTCRLFGMPSPHLLCRNLRFYKILRRFRDM